MTGILRAIAKASYRRIRNFGSAYPKVWWDKTRICGPSEEFIKVYTKTILVDEPYKFVSKSEMPVIFDAGCNIGLALIYFKHLYPKARITAFEADKDIVASYTKKNLEFNGLMDVNLIDKAVWSEATTLTFYNNGRAAGSLAGKVDDLANVTSVQTVRLRDYLEKESHIDFMKMDIEGAELEVLEDCKDQLHKIDNLFVEYHGFKGKKLECSRLLSLLEESGLRYQVKGTAKNFEGQRFSEAYGNLDCIIEIFAKRF